MQVRKFFVFILFTRIDNIKNMNFQTEKYCGTGYINTEQSHKIRDEFIHTAMADIVLL